MSCGNLDSKVAIFFPRGRQCVAVFVEEGLVVPEHVRGSVVAEAANLTIDVAEGEHCGVVTIDDIGKQIGEVGSVVAGCAGCPGNVVVGGEEDGVGPS